MLSMAAIDMIKSSRLIRFLLNTLPMTKLN